MPIEFRTDLLDSRGMCVVLINCVDLADSGELFGEGRPSELRKQRCLAEELAMSRLPESLAARALRSMFENATPAGVALNLGDTVYWEFLLCLRMVTKCVDSQYVSQRMWMTHPNQTGGPQGHCNVNCDGLAANDVDNGSGWQQSRQNHTPLAVMGFRV